jgi:PAS domain S-box-containing protein
VHVSAPVGARTYIAATAALGAILVTGAAVAVAGDGVERPELLLLFGVVIVFSERVPLFVIQDHEGEGLALSDVFLIAMAMLLPPFEALLGFTVAMLVAEAMRRASPTKGAFNVGQFAVSGAAAIGAMHAVTDFDTVGLVQVAAAVFGGVVYFAINTALVAGVISLYEHRPFRQALATGLDTRLFVWAGNVSLGLLMGLTGAAHSWAIPVAIAPVGMLHLAFAAHIRARRAHERMDGLFRTAVAAHRTMGVEQVLEALTESARELLGCNHARVAASPPGEGELGVPIAGMGAPSWLIVADRRGVEPFIRADHDLLEAVAAIGATAVENASLYEQVESEGEKMANILASSSDGIFSVDADQRIQAWNPAMERITGLAAAEVIGGPCTIFGARDERGMLVCPDTCPGRCGFHGEPVPLQVTAPSGEVRWLNCTYSPMPGGGYVVVARDVTAQKEVEELKADFLATVSHELRTPLTPIKGFLATLRDKDGDFTSGERVHLYEVMQRQADRLERLVTDLLDATSMDQQGTPLFLSEQLHWGVTVARIIELFAREQPDRQLVLDCPVDLPDVVADEQRAEQVLTNLLSNAAKYSPVGSRITIRLEHTGEDVRTTVIDLGPGIDANHRDRIFERFTRLGDYRTRSSGGAGLGLFIAKRLVEGMGGTIAVDDGPDGGAAFSFTLPVVEHAAKPR